jgi:predicted N-formylglutamate amidohydrolase
VKDQSSKPSPLLDPDERPPYSRYNPGGESGVVFVCDHARNAVPRSLAGLGLSSEVLETHIGLDIGCESLSRQIADRLDGTLVIAGFSRLVVDLNRPPGHPTAIPSHSDGIEIPGNRSLAKRDRQRRIDEIFTPYHEAVAAELEQASRRHARVALISMHSFTPRMGSEVRPWHIGILWSRDQRLSEPLLESLRREPDLCVGDNQPYDARDHLGYTVDTYDGMDGLAQVMIEVRQDLLLANEDVSRWADLLAEHLTQALDRWGVSVRS